jgi:hypothetical protein
LCNAAGNPPGLTISAWPIISRDSLKLFTVTPFQISLDSLRPEQQKKAWEYGVTVKNSSSEAIELTLVSAPTQFMTIDMPGSRIKPGKEKTITIKIDKDIADQTFSKSFTIEASDSAKTRVTIPISKAVRWGDAQQPAKSQ